MSELCYFSSLITNKKASISLHTKLNQVVAHVHRLQLRLWSWHLTSRLCHIKLVTRIHQECSVLKFNQQLLHMYGFQVDPMTYLATHLPPDKRSGTWCVNIRHLFRLHIVIIHKYKLTKSKQIGMCDTWICRYLVYTPPNVLLSPFYLLGVTISSKTSSWAYFLCEATLSFSSSMDNDKIHCYTYRFCRLEYALRFLICLLRVCLCDYFVVTTVQ